MSSPETLTCASCGSDEPAGSAFCGNCGAPFAAPEAEPTVTSTAAESPGVQTCASCGNEEPEGSEFCGNCGAAMSATAVLEPQVDAWPDREPPRETPPAPLWRKRPVVLSALGVLVVAIAVAALFGTGAIGGDSGLSQSAFLRQVNTGAMGPLRQAVEAAAQDASSGLVGADGTRIVDTASGGAKYLRVLHGLTAKQRDEMQLLLAYLAANVQYGQALGAFNSDDAATRLALDRAVQSVRSTGMPLPTGVELAAPQSYVSSQGLPAPPPPPPPPPAGTSVSAVSYAQQVDALLRQSHAVVVSLGSFVPRAARGEISRGQAVADARSYLSQRRRELLQAASLDVPPDFAQAQGLLIRSLQASVVDDQALLAWAIARRDGGDAQAAFKEANRLGKQATRFKRRFLSLYGSLRQQATGRAPSSLPAFF